MNNVFDQNDEKTREESEVTDTNENSPDKLKQTFTTDNIEEAAKEAECEKTDTEVDIFLQESADVVQPEITENTGDVSKKTTFTRLKDLKNEIHKVKQNNKTDAFDESILKPGNEIGGCMIIEFIGKGGMGSVYKAKQISLDKIVAVKVLAKKFIENKDFISNFVTEARVAAKIEHQNVVQVFDTGIYNNIPYILMQYVSGKNLRDISREYKLSSERLLNYFWQAASGIAAAHSKKVVHRDIKPENLVLTQDDLLKITDFGLARLKEDLTDDRPIDGKIMASASFMSPEQGDLNPVDFRSDLYSLGVCFYSLFTGKKPFTGENHFEIILKHHLEQPKCATLRNREIPLSIAAILDKLLRKNPNDRYQTAQELLKDIEKLRKYNYLNIEQPWRFETFAVHKINPSSIEKKGYKICIKKQQEKLNVGQDLELLGQIMLKENFVQMSEPLDCEKLMPENLTFIVSKDSKNEIQKYSLVEFDNLSSLDNDIVEHKIIYTPVLVEWNNFTLKLILQNNFRNSIEVQHFFDFIDNYPYPLAFEAVVYVMEIELTIADLHWIIDTHNLIRKKKGDFKIVITQKHQEEFFVKNKIDKFIDMENKIPVDKPEITKNYDFIESVVDELINDENIFLNTAEINAKQLTEDNPQQKLKKFNEFAQKNSLQSKNSEITDNEIDIVEIMDELDVNKSNDKKQINQNNDNILESEPPAQQLADTLLIENEDLTGDSKTDINSELSDKKSKRKKFESTYITKTPFLYQPNEDEQDMENFEAQKIRDLFNKGDFEQAFKEVVNYILSGKQQDDEFRAITSEIAVKLFSEGEYLLKQKNYKQAQIKFEKVIEIKSNEFGAYFYKSMCLKKLGKLSTALEFINVAIKLEHNNAELYYNRAILYSRLKQIQKSIDNLTKVIQLDPQHYNAYYNRGLGYEKLKQFSFALDDYKRALDLNPEFRKILTPRLKKISLELDKGKNNS